MTGAKEFLTTYTRSEIGLITWQYLENLVTGFSISAVLTQLPLSRTLSRLYCLRALESSESKLSACSEIKKTKEIN